MSISYLVKCGPCAVCNIVAYGWCSRCDTTFYCSRQHQAEDWQWHESICVPTSAYTYNFQVTAPSPSTGLVFAFAAPSSSTEPVVAFDALYFSKYEEYPRIVPVYCLPPADPASSMCPRPVIAVHLSCSSDGQPPASIILQQGIGCKLRYPLHVWYCPGSRTVNRVAWRMTCGQAPRPWRGDVLVMKYAGGRRQGYMDATSLDLPPVVQLFMSQR
ncbi:hypothetical protein EXIGLDRAFT_611915 [Exidia glandulosa HHB12029]|uniref:MYND-type domain-containing protein n=1 Tax=Exidia glandulosa HHB12029 TaxID=1314781 RepID=A0A165J3W7_EXIGL|nr:hypothetical protein EXIGLDRAFT_611915 [Exidia glandulosa HHB12029]